MQGCDTTNINYEHAIQRIIEQYKSSPVDILDIGDAGAEYNYLLAGRDSYIRTIRDIDSLFSPDRAAKRILEIGSFLGPVSICLKQLGYDVYATDIPEFANSSRLRALYAKHDIPFQGVNLRSHQLPYDSEFFDAVIMCEVLEHLNFNPLPVFREINRVTRRGRYLYIGTPNQTRMGSRIRLFRGKSIREPIDHFLAQLDRNDNMIVGLHWREYTLSETVELVEKMGFQMVTAYYFTPKVARDSSPRSVLKSALYNAVPSFRPYQVVMGQKRSEPKYEFWLTEANT